MTELTPRETEHRRDPLTVGLVALAGLLVLLEVLVATVPVVGTNGVAFAVGAGTVPLALALASGGLYRWLSKAPTLRGLAITVTCVMMVLIMGRVVGVAQSALAPGERQLSDAERQDLQVTEAELRHPAFGFVAPNPGVDFIVDRDRQDLMNRELAREPGMFAWVFTRSDASELAVLQVARLAAPRGEWFRRYTEGIRSGAQGAGTSQVVEDALVSVADSPEYRLALLNPESGVYLRWRCIPSDTLRDAPFVVCAMTVGADPESLTGFREGLRVAGPSPEP